MPKKKKQKYWYRQYVGECPVCGRLASYSERVYGKRPKLYKDRVKWLSDTATYCGCVDSGYR